MKDFNDDNFCFVCGTGNPNGLRLSFTYNEGTGDVVSETVFPRHFQGWEGVLHGGIISMVLDEIMIKAAEHKGLKCVTAELNVKFKKPALTNTPYVIRGKINEIKRKLALAEGAVTDADKKVIATASSKLFIL
ncbi:MAG: PaaI family thioesterase [bacterium]|nr:PaaI family thioesterase [bacterium]